MSEHQPVLHVICLVLLSASSIVNAGRLRSDISVAEVDEILGGTAVPIGARKYQALILATKAGSTSLCGGTLISKDHILTAAHCVDKKPYTKLEVFTKIHKISPMDATRISRTVANEDIRVHADWNSATLANDIAILRLNASVDLNQVAVAPLPPLKTTSDFSKTSAVAVGWGLTANNATSVSSTLQQVTLAIQDKLLCEAIFRDSYNHTSQLCTYKPNQSICQGDSGGPLMVGSVQVGISSFVQGSATGARCERGAVFTRVSFFNNNGWIKQNMMNATAAVASG